MTSWVFRLCGARTLRAASTLRSKPYFWSPRQQAPAFLGGKDSITTARWWFTPAWTGLFHRQPAMAVATVH